MSAALLSQIAEDYLTARRARSSATTVKNEGHVLHRFVATIPSATTGAAAVKAAAVKAAYVPAPAPVVKVALKPAPSPRPSPTPTDVYVFADPVVTATITNFKCRTISGGSSVSFTLTRKDHPPMNLPWWNLYGEGMYIGWMTVDGVNWEVDYDFSNRTC